MYSNIFSEAVDIAEVRPTGQAGTLAFASGVLSWLKNGCEKVFVAVSKKQISIFPLDGLTYSEDYDSAQFTVAYRGGKSSIAFDPLLYGEKIYVYVLGYNGVQSSEVYSRGAVSELEIITLTESGILTEDGGFILAEDGSTILTET